MRGFLRLTSLCTEFSSDEEDAQFLGLLFLFDEFIVFSPPYAIAFVFNLNCLFVDFFTVGASVSLELSLIVSALD